MKTKTLEFQNPQSCLNRAEYDEPIFVLLGRDAAAKETLRQWIEERLRLGLNKADDKQIQEAYEMIHTMEIYRQKRTEKIARDYADEERRTRRG